MKFFELIYCESSLQEIIKKEFPEAVFEDESDCIHTDRFSVDIESDNENIEEQFYIFAMKQGFVRNCLQFELMLRTDTDIPKIKGWITKAAEKKECHAT